MSSIQLVVTCKLTMADWKKVDQITTQQTTRTFLQSTIKQVTKGNQLQREKSTFICAEQESYSREFIQPLTVCNKPICPPKMS